MTEITKTRITVETKIKAPIEKAWRLWTDPNHIIRWNQASDDWHTTYAENDLKPGGRFLSRMESKDGVHGFDMTGQYTTVENNQRIEYTMDDDRKVEITFDSDGDHTIVKETFEADSSHSAELQQAGWQAIMDNFKKHVETADRLETLRFEITINAGAEKVYRTMLNDQTYRIWAAEFEPTSHYEGTWDKGSKIHFLGINEDNKKGGMVSMIKENIPNKFLSIQHLGMVEDGEEILTGPAAEVWGGALENYTFKGDHKTTTLLVETDTDIKYKQYFEETWPKALQKLKAICE